MKRRNPSSSVASAGVLKSLRGFQGFTPHTLSRRAEEQEQANSPELSQSATEKKVSEHLAAAGL